MMLLVIHRVISLIVIIQMSNYLKMTTFLTKIGNSKKQMKLKFIFVIFVIQLEAGTTPFLVHLALLFVPYAS